MRSTLTRADVQQMLLAAAGTMIGSEARLNALDAAIGDGDHGITMRLGFECIQARLAALDDAAGFDEIFTGCGRAFLGATGGAIGVIFGKCLMSAGTALRDCEEFGTRELKTMLCAMETGIQQAGKARPGDKTILDAVHAAREAADRSADAGHELGEALANSAAAAETAARQTADLICRAGRASRLGERALGHPDPGATSFAIFLRAFRDGAGS
jgi:phosphoenolpyruvate---glycerone phosphotransferase subunit DhaL